MLSYCFLCFCCFYLSLQLPCQMGSWMDVGLREDVKWTGLSLSAQMEAASTHRTARPKRGEWPALALSEVNVKELVGSLAGNSSWDCTFRDSWKREYGNRCHYCAVFSAWDMPSCFSFPHLFLFPALFSRKWQSGKKTASLKGVRGPYNKW